MKKLLLSFVLLACSFMLNAQMTVTVSGNNVTFSTPIPGADWGTAPVNLYAYAETMDTTPNLASTVQIFGNWPGVALVDNGSGVFSTTVNFSTVFPLGTKINDFKFIYNSPDGMGGFYQNPAGGSPGFSINDVAHAIGYTPVTTTALGVVNMANAKKNTVVTDGQLRTSFKGNLSLEVYEMGGKLVKSFNANSDGNAIDLNITKTGIYFVKITNGTNSEVVKFAK